MRASTSVDAVRAAIAVAMGHQGYRARVHLGTGGELSGRGAFGDCGYVAGGLLTVKGYSRMTKKKGVTAGRGPGREGGGVRVPPGETTTGTPSASKSASESGPAAPRAAPPGSPGFRIRNYVRETEGVDVAEGGGALRDPLAAPVPVHDAPAGGRRAAAAPPLKVPSLSSLDEGGAGLPTGAAASAGDGLWAELFDEAAAAAAIVARVDAEEDAAVAGSGGGWDGEDGAAETDRKRKHPPPPTAVRTAEARRSRGGNRDGEGQNPKGKTRRKPAKKTEEGRGDEREGTTDKPSAALPPPLATRDDASPLPPALERLARGYERIAAVAAFLQLQRLRPTWRFVSSALGGIVGGVAGGKGDTGNHDITPVDLRAMAALCPSSLRLTAVALAEDRRDTALLSSDRRATNGDGDGGRDDMGETPDVLLAVTLPHAGRSARDFPPATLRGEGDSGANGGELDAPVAALDAVVHGYRTSSRTYGGGNGGDSGEEDGGVGEATRPKKRRRKRTVTEGAVRKKVEAFRRGLGLAVIAEVDALVAEAVELSVGAVGRSKAAIDPWETVNKLPASAFVARAEAERRGSHSPDDATDRIDKRRGHGGDRIELSPVAANRRGGDGVKYRGGRGIKCCRKDALAVDDFIAHLTTEDGALGSKGQCEHRVDIPGRELRYAHDLPGCPTPTLSPATVTALAASGVPTRHCSGRLTGQRQLSLFSHQAKGVSAALAGRNVVVATGTASGKSVCYNAPILEALLHDPEAHALYLFPTKALAQDQLRALRVMLEGVAADGADGWEAAEDGPGRVDIPDVGVYDGDTREDERRRVRAEARLIITNPDMIHVSLLPQHKSWERVLRSLKYVVLDEAHVYRGVFGSHVALVVRRLRRLCREVYGGDPTFIVTSATIANPREHAADLVGDFRGSGSVHDGGCTVDGWEVVDVDGSPCGRKTFLMWNPPLREVPQPTNKKKDGKPRRKNVARKHVESADAVADAGEARGKSAVAARLRSQPTVSNSDPVLMTATGDEFTGAWKAREAAKRSKATGQTLTPAEQKALGSTRGALGIYANGGRTPRSSPIVEVSLLLAECVRHNLRCIAFCKTKKLCELVLRYCRETLRDTSAPELADTVCAYRGGYAAEDRRAVEGALFAGKLRGVTATNALELGVDVGTLDVTLHLGFPGSVASLVQQAGRAGRRGRRALGVYVAFDGPLDQYFMREPGRLFSRPIERAAIDPSNATILEAHAACAAHELPLDPRVMAAEAAGGNDARLYFGSQLGEACAALVRKKKLGRDPGLSALRSGDARLRWIGAGGGLIGGGTGSDGDGGFIPNASSSSSLNSARGPAHGVSIRTIEEERYRIVDEVSGRIIEEVEASKAFWEVYPGAVYLNQARTFLCKALDTARREATVRLVDVKYFTSTIDHTRVTLVDHAGTAVAYPDRPGPATAELPPGRRSSAQCSEVDVEVEFTGYNKIWQGSGQVFDTVEMRNLPEVKYRTVAAWIRVPDAARRAAREAGLEFRAGLHAATHALINVLPLYLMASNADVAAECDNPHHGHYRPQRLLIYDRHPGGVGIARQAAPIFVELLRAAVELIEGCGCGDDAVGKSGGGERTSDAIDEGTYEAGRSPDPGGATDEVQEVDEVEEDAESRTGCPGCVHYLSCDQYNAVLDKRAALIVLRATIASEERAFASPSRGVGGVVADAREKVPAGRTGAQGSNAREGRAGHNASEMCQDIVSGVACACCQGGEAS